MKKTLLFAVLTVALIRANAQQGSILLYGAIAYSSTTTTLGENTKEFAFAPGLGYQFSDNWTAGLAAELGHTSDGTNKESLLQIGPFLRYTRSISGIFSIYGQMDVDYIHNTFNFGFPPQSGYDFKLFPAVFIDIKNGFGLNFDFGGIEYQSTTQSDLIPKDHTNIFAFTFGQGIIVGISKNFGGRKK